MFCSGDDIGFRRIHHDDAPFRGPVDIDVVHPVTGAAHHLQVLGSLIEFFVDFRHAADDDGIIFTHDLQQFFPRDVEFDSNFQVRLRLQHFHAFVRNPFHHDDFFLVHVLSLLSSSKRVK